MVRTIERAVTHPGQGMTLSAYARRDRRYTRQQWPAESLSLISRLARQEVDMVA